jgi:hypothetical protein
MNTAIRIPDKEAIKNKITSNIKNREIDPWNTEDELGFLVENKVLLQIPSTPSGTIVLKNSWTKKSEHLIIGLGSLFVLYLALSYFELSESYWPWMILFMIAIAPIAYFFFGDFFARKVVAEISTQSLILEGHVSLPWRGILYLHFKTVHKDRAHGTYLIVTLKDGREYEIKVSDLSWSKERLGKLLYLYMIAD